MTNYVDIIKTKLNTILTNETLKDYEDKKIGRQFIATAINELLGCHNEETLERYNNNKIFVTKIIVNLFLKHPEIKENSYHVVKTCTAGL